MTSLCLLLAAPVLAAFGSEVKITTDFPGANVVVESVKGNTVSVRPDTRTSTGECAPRHWAFRVRGAAGRTLEFVFPKDPIFGHLTTRGPAVSHDGCVSWRWMTGGVPENPPDRFSYSFGSAENDVIFSWQPLYTGDTLRRFLNGPGKGKIRLETLCRTDRGRDAELLRFGNDKAPAGVFLAARHHANEIWASFVLEGLMREAVSDSETGRYLRANASFVVMPFTDKDGVEDGDPGKNRRPHDHNRDYHKGRYPTIRAIRPYVKDWAADKRHAYGFDFHACSLEIRGRRLHDPKAWAHNMLFQIYTGSPQSVYAHRIFSAALKKAHDNRTELMQYIGNDGMRTAPAELGMCERWMNDTLPPGYTATLESPAAHPDGRPATPEDAYRLGAHLAQALAVLIREDARHQPFPKTFATDTLKTPVAQRPVPGYLQDEERSFQSAPSVTVTRGGRLWLAWHTGGSDEGDENAVIVASSGDGGTTWSKPLFAFDMPGPMRYLDPGFWTDPDGRVWLFFCQLYGYWDGRGGLWAMSPDDAEREDAAWSAPRRLCDGFMKNKPLVLADGRWLLPVEFLQSPVATKERPLKPFNFENVKMNDADVFVSADKGQTCTYLSQAHVPPKDRSCHEHMIVSRRDGSLWMLVRTRGGLGESVSRDGGKTWSEVRRSKICNPESRFHLSRLASGALLLVKNGPVDRQTTRSQMRAYVSDDDGASWKGGLVLDGRENVSYPDAAQGADGTIYIVHDFERTGGKEIVFHRVKEADIRAGRLVTKGSVLKVIANKAGGR